MNSYDFALIAGTILLFLVLGFVVTIFLVHLKKNKEYRKERELLQLTFQKELLKVQLEVQEQTFKDISQEIHDNIGQMLTLAKLNLSTMDVHDVNSVTEKTEDTRHLISNAISNLRDLSRTLNTDIITIIGLPGVLETELNRIQKTGSVKTKLVITGNRSESLSADSELILFRITQESLQNIIKHAGASLVTVELEYLKEFVRLKITDNGRGFDADNILSTGSGLINMKTRAQLIGATLNLISSEEGTEITIVVKTPE